MEFLNEPSAEDKQNKQEEYIPLVAHELKTPLAVIREGISLLVDGVCGPLNDKQRKILTMSSENITRLTRIIEDLLEVSKMEGGRLKLRKSLVDICILLQESCEKWQLEVSKKNQTLRLFIEEKQQYIYVDPGIIQQVVDNLISNAIKYSQERGNIEIFLKNEGAHILIVVKDTGIGISQEDFPKIFEKFQRFKRDVNNEIKGTGLGLSIVKQFIDLHKGTIAVESELGKGTTFHIRLPKLDVDSVFSEYINDGIAEAKQRKASISLIIVRVFRFKELLAELGPEKAHGFLKELERAVDACLRRQADTVVRDTGELMVMLFDTRPEDVYKVKERIEQIIKQTLKENKEEWVEKIVIHFGQSTYPDEAGDDKTLLAKARQGVVSGSN